MLDKQKGIPLVYTAGSDLLFNPFKLNGLSHPYKLD